MNNKIPENLLRKLTDKGSCISPDVHLVGWGGEGALDWTNVLIAQDVTLLCVPFLTDVAIHQGCVIDVESRMVSSMVASGSRLEGVYFVEGAVIGRNVRVLSVGDTSFLERVIMEDDSSLTCFDAITFSGYIGKGATCCLKDNAYQVRIGPSSSVGTVLAPVVLGEGAYIAEHVHFKGCSLGANSAIQKRAEVGKRSSVGANCVIREEVKVGADVNIPDNVTIDVDIPDSAAFFAVERQPDLMLVSLAEGAHTSNAFDSFYLNIQTGLRVSDEDVERVLGGGDSAVENTSEAAEVQGVSDEPLTRAQHYLEEALKKGPVTLAGLGEDGGDLVLYPKGQAEK